MLIFTRYIWILKFIPGFAIVIAEFLYKLNVLNEISSTTMPFDDAFCLHSGTLR